MWLNKSQIELSVAKKSAGNINAAAFLPSTRVKQEEQKSAPVETKKPAPAEVTPAASDSAVVLDLKHDWY